LNGLRLVRGAAACLLIVAAVSASALATAWAQQTPGVPAPETPEGQWQAYKQRFIAREGRLIDDSAQSVSHSEGQGYAMLLAAFSGDRVTFSQLWSWTLANLYIRGDGLAAWRWRPQDKPHVLDRNNATDGDLLIAWALAEAGRKWKNADYIAQSRKISLAVGRLATYNSLFGKALSPGVAGFGPKDSEDGPVVNASYWVFPAFDALAEVAPEVDWAAIRSAGLALIDGAKFGPKRLPSDWVSVKFGLQPASAFPKNFGYDAVRVPLYLAWGAPFDRARLQAFADGWAGATDQTPSVIDVESGAAVEPFADEGYKAVAALVRCAVTAQRLPDDLRSVHLDRYYSATLHMLSLAAIRQRLPQCL